MRHLLGLLVPVFFLFSLLAIKAGPKAGRLPESARSDFLMSQRSVNPMADNPLLSYSTYVGGKASPLAVTVDQAGNAYITGAAGPGLPTTPGAFKRDGTGAFAMKLNAEGTSVVYLTYLGPGAGNSIAVDSFGNAYVAGRADSPDFPVTASAYQKSFGGSGQSVGDAFVVKLDPSGSSLLYSTYLGGSDGDSGNGIAIDSAGNAYVSGRTRSTDFPTTPGAFQSVFGGGMFNGDAFVAKLNATGSALLFSTYLGGDQDESVGRIAVDADGSAYITGSTPSTNFPVTAGAFQTIKAGGLCYSFIPEAPPFPCPDAFLTKVSADGKSLVYSTYFGGTGSDSASAVAVDSGGNACVVGTTSSRDLPTTPGAFSVAPNGGGDAFIAKFDSTGSRMIYSTYLGGEDFEEAYGLAIDPIGQISATGVTGSERFPTTPGAINGSPDDVPDIFVTKLSADGSKLVFSTSFGGEFTEVGNSVASDSAGDLYVTGYTLSSRFPTTGGAFRIAKSADIDGFVTKFQIGPAIRKAVVKGKKLIVTGINFDDGALIIVDGEEQKTINDEENPKSRLIGKKSGRKIAPGQSVMIRAKNPNGMISLEFRFARPGE
jgi:hypothetical protein